MACCDPVVTSTPSVAPRAGEPAVPPATTLRSASRPSVGPYCSAVVPVEPSTASTASSAVRIRAVGNDSGAGSPPASERTPGVSTIRSRSRISELRARVARRASAGWLRGTVGAAIEALHHPGARTGRAWSWGDQHHQGAEAPADPNRAPRTQPRLQNAPVARRADLAAFLRARRAAVAPEDVGLEPGPRRRTPGLRREEVALLAGVSVSWYTWLEQGRPINASIDVLDALARALRLDAVERAHLLELAGHATRQPIELGRSTCPRGVLELLRTLEPAPAFALGPTS